MSEQANPYAPPKAVVSDAAAEAGEFDKASRGSRLGAALLDTAVSFIVALPFIITVIPSLAASYDPTNPPNVMQMLTAASMGGVAVTLLLSIAWIIVTIILVSRNGQTIGKKMVGIKVVRSSGERATLGRIFWLRNVVNLLPSMIPVVGSIYGLVDTVFIFAEPKQCLHDKIADTIVVRA